MTTEVPPLAAFLPPTSPEARAARYCGRLRRRVCCFIREGRAHVIAARLGKLYARLTTGVQYGDSGYRLSRLVASEVHTMETLAWAASERDHELSHRLAMARQGLHFVEVELQRAVEVLR